MSLSVEDNIRRCIEKFGAHVSESTRSRSMTRKSPFRSASQFGRGKADEPRAEAASVEDSPPKVT